MFFFHVLLLQHGCSENTPYDFFKRKLSLVGGDNRGHLHENIAPGAGTFTYFLQPISPSPRLCPGWGDRGFTLTGALRLYQNHFTKNHFQAKDLRLPQTAYNARTVSEQNSGSSM